MSDIRWEFIQRHLNLPERSRVLDVGYGNGAFLKRARAAGMSIFGIDLHSEDFGIPVVDFETTITFDLVCLFNSLEHFPDFEPLLKLKTRAVVVSIPNTPACILTTPTDWRHFKPGEHLHYFSHRSLELFMRKWGFQRKFADGYPEDALRGKLSLGGKLTNNIYTAIFGRVGNVRFRKERQALSAVPKDRRPRRAEGNAAILGRRCFPPCLYASAFRLCFG